MKRILAIIIVSFFEILFCVEKPQIKIGYTGNENFTKLENKEFIYPSTIKDSISLSIEETLSQYFSFKYKINFDYSNYNKYTKNLDDLTSYNINNLLSLTININNFNQLLLNIKPCYYNKYGEKYFYDSNMIGYTLRTDNFSLKTYYSNQFSLKNDELIIHKANLSFYWNFPDQDYLKFKSSFTVYFQQGIYYQANVSHVKSININFEIALDFNKIKFEELFKNNDYTEDFFYD